MMTSKIAASIEDQSQLVVRFDGRGGGGDDDDDDDDGNGNGGDDDGDGGDDDGDDRDVRILGGSHILWDISWDLI